MALDAWVALKALLPPKERRGVILIDPPFEERDELDRMAAGLTQGLQRFATGVYIAWYPIKDLKPVARFHAALAALAMPESLRIELMLERPTRSRSPQRLRAHRRQSALYAGRRACCRPARAQPPPGVRLEGAASYRLDWIGPARGGSTRAAPSRSGVCAPGRKLQALICLAQVPAITDTPPQFGRPIDPAETAETDLR